MILLIAVFLVFWSGFRVLVYRFCFLCVPEEESASLFHITFCTLGLSSLITTLVLGKSSWRVLDLASPTSSLEPRLVKVLPIAGSQHWRTPKCSMVFQKGKGQIPPESDHILPFEFDQSWDYICAHNKGNLECSVLLLELLYFYWNLVF